MAPATGLEPMTFCSAGRRSGQLRYTGEYNDTTECSAAWNRWQAQRESNPH